MYLFKYINIWIYWFLVCFVRLGLSYVRLISLLNIIIEYVVVKIKRF